MDPVFLIFLVLIFGLLFLMMSRGRKQQREAAKLRSSLEVGDEIMTGSGLYGTITAIDGDVVTVESTPGVPTRWYRPAISKKVDPSTEYASGEEDDDEAPEIESQASEGTSTPDGFLSEDQVRRPYREGKSD